MKISRWPDHPRNLAWHRDDKKGTHVALPLDVSAVPDAVVERVAQGIGNAWSECVAGPRFIESWGVHMARAAIAALAAALGEVSDG
jgi:hypothetical protein